MGIRRIKILAVACLLFCGCSGGGGGGDPAQPMPSLPLPIADASAGGFWEGVVSFDLSQTSELFVALATEDGRFRFISGESELQFVGVFVTATNRATGTGLGYADPGSTWLDGSSVTDATAEAVIVERDSMSGSWSTASGESGSFDFFYDSEYERPSLLSSLEGIWTAYDDFGNPAATFTIDDQGQFTGQNTSGCVSSGQFSIIDDRYNLYGVASTISGCFIAGDYSGLAALGDLAATNDAVALTISNDLRAIVLGLEK